MQKTILKIIKIYFEGNNYKDITSELYLKINKFKDDKNLKES